MSDSATFDRDPRNAKRARRFVTDRLQGYQPRLVDDAALMASELVTNSIRHATGAVTITLEINDDTLRIAVSDAGPGVPTVRTPAPVDNSGRGLQIVATLADDWGLTANGDAGNTVWFSLHLDGSTSRDDAVEADGTGRPDSRRMRGATLPQPDARGEPLQATSPPPTRSSGIRWPHADNTVSSYGACTTKRGVARRVGASATY